MEYPPTYNIADYNRKTAPPPSGDQVNDREAQQLLRRCYGIYLPLDWATPDAIGQLNATRFTFMHSYKMTYFFRRQLFLTWWFSMPCRR